MMRQLQEKGAEFRALEPTGDIRHILATTLFNSFVFCFLMETSTSTMVARKIQFFYKNFFAMDGIKEC